MVLLILLPKVLYKSDIYNILAVVADASLQTNFVQARFLLMNSCTEGILGAAQRVVLYNCSKTDAHFCIASVETEFEGKFHKAVLSQNLRPQLICPKELEAFLCSLLQEQKSYYLATRFSTQCLPFTRRENAQPQVRFQRVYSFNSINRQPGTREKK
jgi:hypothetical protein